MKKILVTGGLGYIGSHTVVELILSGFDVVIVDNLFNSSLDVLQKIEKITGVLPKFYKCDLLDVYALENVLSFEKIDGVIHFAALKAVGESVNKPLWYYENNISGTINLLRLMGKFDIKNIVFSSSATVYGNDNPVPFDESMQTSAVHPYGFTKVACEQFLMDIAKIDKDFSPAILRYFNPIGAHSSGLLGEDPNGIPNNLLPYIAKVLTGELEHLSIFGTDYDTVDGTGVRDYIHVVDIALGHVLAIKHLAQNKGIITVNLGTGKGSSVLEVVSACEKASGIKIPVKLCDRRDGDIATCYADTKYSKELLGWVATKDLDEMCNDTWNYIINKKK